MDEEEMMMQQMSNAPQPAMPSMEGASMPSPMNDMPPEAVSRLMKPSEEIGAVLMARISNMSPEDLRMLDQAISPDVIQILMKLLPELAQIIQRVGEQNAPPTSPMPQDRQMGALGGM
jgi:hypothetical protein|tara:strand:+ start:3278 stop:3631 length:354 start_codon:yes stop_codon:yes gene_type:complete